MYTRAQGVDFDDWETKGWTANDLLPLMKRVWCLHRIHYFLKQKC
jgi:alcohol oxidase